MSRVSQLNAGVLRTEGTLDRDVGAIGEALLDRPGVFLMVTLWCVALGCVFLPLRHRRSVAYVLPGLLVGLSLAMLAPSLAWIFVVLVLFSSVVMYPATLLVAEDSQITRRRGAMALAAGAVLLVAAPAVPKQAEWLLWPLAPVMMCGLPVGLLLLMEPVLRRRGWYSPVCSVIMFAASWAVWMARDHYYRLKY